MVLDQIRKLLVQYMDAATEVRYTCVETISIEVLNSLMTLSKLFDLLAVRENGVHPSEGEHFVPTIQSWFLFCLIWSVGASVDEPGRNTFDVWLRDQDPRFTRLLSQGFISTLFDFAIKMCLIICLCQCN